MNKEFLYVGYYFDVDNKLVLKPGTTNNLARRRREHNTAYRNSPHHTMPKENSFEYLFSVPLSKYNTLRYEDRNKKLWQEWGVGEYIRNDRFVCETIPEQVIIRIRKDYVIDVKCRIV